MVIKRKVKKHNLKRKRTLVNLDDPLVYKKIFRKYYGSPFPRSARDYKFNERKLDGLQYREKDIKDANFVRFLKKTRFQPWSVYENFEFHESSTDFIECFRNHMRLNYVFCKLEGKFAKEILFKCREAAEKFYKKLSSGIDNRCVRNQIADAIQRPQEKYGEKFVCIGEYITKFKEIMRDDKNKIKEKIDAIIMFFCSSLRKYGKRIDFSEYVSRGLDKSNWQNLKQLIAVYEFLDDDQHSNSALNSKERNLRAKSGQSYGFYQNTVAYNNSIHEGFQSIYSTQSLQDLRNTVKHNITITNEDFEYFRKDREYIFDLFLKTEVIDENEVKKYREVFDNKTPEELFNSSYDGLKFILPQNLNQSLSESFNESLSVSTTEKDFDVKSFTEEINNIEIKDRNRKSLINLMKKFPLLLNHYVSGLNQGWQYASSPQPDDTTPEVKDANGNNEEKKIKDLVLKGNFEKVILIYQNQTDEKPETFKTSVQNNDNFDKNYNIVLYNVDDNSENSDKLPFMRLFKRQANSHCYKETTIEENELTNEEQLSKICFKKEKVEFEREINLTENQQKAEQMKLYLVYTMLWESVVVDDYDEKEYQMKEFLSWYDKDLVGVIKDQKARLYGVKNYTNYRIAAYDDLDYILNKINKLVAKKQFPEDVQKLLENLHKTALAVLNSEQTVVNFNLLRFCLDKERTEILFERLFEMVKKEKLDKEKIKKEFLLLGLVSGLARGEKEENLKDSNKDGEPLEQGNLKSPRMESYSKKIDRRSSKKLVEKHVDKKDSNKDVEPLEQGNPKSPRMESSPKKTNRRSSKKVVKNNVENESPAHDEDTSKEKSPKKRSKRSSSRRNEENNENSKKNKESAERTNKDKDCLLKEILHKYCQEIENGQEKDLLDDEGAKSDEVKEEDLSHNKSTRTVEVSSNECNKVEVRLNGEYKAFELLLLELRKVENGLNINETKAVITFKAKKYALKFLRDDNKLKNFIRNEQLVKIFPCEKSTSALKTDKDSCNAVEFDIKQKNGNTKFNNFAYWYYCMSLISDKAPNVDKTTAVITFNNVADAKNFINEKKLNDLLLSRRLVETKACKTTQSDECNKVEVDIGDKTGSYQLFLSKLMCDNNYNIDKSNLVITFQSERDARNFKQQNKLQGIVENSRLVKALQCDSQPKNSKGISKRKKRKYQEVADQMIKADLLKAQMRKYQKRIKKLDEIINHN